MIEGSCHCGEVHWRYDGRPDSATACNCTWCRRHGVLWAYADEGNGIDVHGATRQYLRGERVIEFHFCAVCGCLAYWRAVHANPRGRRRMAVNLRLAEPAAVADIPIEHFDGLDTYKRLPRDGKCVADYWF